MARLIGLRSRKQSTIEITQSPTYSVFPHMMGVRVRGTIPDGEAGWADLLAMSSAVCGVLCRIRSQWYGFLSLPSFRSLEPIPALPVTTVYRADSELSAEALPVTYLKEFPLPPCRVGATFVVQPEQSHPLGVKKPTTPSASRARFA